MEYLWIKMEVGMEGEEYPYPVIMPFGWRVPCLGYNKNKKEINRQADKFIELYNRELHRIANIS